jgi:uncharacterized protein YaeQ
VALGATIYNIHIDLADNDRQVYESLDLRLARHPSESEEYLVTRLLAYALELTEGIAFSPGGLSDPDEPAITVRDLTGALRSWIEIGNPDPARLHRASKASPRVAVYTHRDIERLSQSLAAAQIHRAQDLELYAIDRRLITALAERLERRMVFTLSVSDRELFLSLDSGTVSGKVVRAAAL